MDKTCFYMGAKINWVTDIMASSWSKVAAYDTDFGLGLGMPVTVRRPRFDNVKGLAFFMPKMGRGKVSVAVCLKGADMERLEKDEGRRKFATLIG